MTNSLYCGVTFKELYINHTGKFRQCCIQTQSFSEKGFLNVADPNKWFSEQRNLDLIRWDLKEGSKNPACTKCWKLEEKGHSSYRVNWNRSTYHAADITPEIEIIDLRLGNQCNLQCRMCNPSSSHLIAKEYKRINLISEIVKASNNSNQTESKYSLAVP